MEELNAFYNRLLLFGLVILREAIHARNEDWAKAEVEMLHNIPSLIGEQNLERHRYFWFVERDLYIEKIAALGLDGPKLRVRTFYEPIWRDMEPVLLRLLGTTDKGRSLKFGPDAAKTAVGFAETIATPLHTA